MTLTISPDDWSLYEAVKYIYKPSVIVRASVPVGTIRTI